MQWLQMDFELARTKRRGNHSDIELLQISTNCKTRKKSESLRYKPTFLWSRLLAPDVLFSGTFGFPSRGYASAT
jgi:hypothetical protein